MTKSIPAWVLTSIFIIAFLGFLDATFLVGEHYLHMVPPCFIVQGCDTVTTSAYSKIAGIPVSVLGMLYYVTVLTLAMYYADKKKKSTLLLLHGITILGFGMSLWFLFAQAFIIKAWCMYCLFSATTSTLLFVFAANAYHRKSVEPLVLPTQM